MLNESEIIESAKVALKPSIGKRVCPGCGKATRLLAEDPYPHLACCGWNDPCDYVGCGMIVWVFADGTQKEPSKQDIATMRAEFNEGNPRGVKRREIIEKITGKLIG